MSIVHKSVWAKALFFAFAGVFMLFGSEAFALGVTGLKPAPSVNTHEVYPMVQALPNSNFTPNCNTQHCAVLFSQGNADLYAPRVETMGPGAPTHYDLHWLKPYKVADGSILYAPLGTGPTEYKTRNGQIRIQFAFTPGVSGGGLPSTRGPY